jgi:hypothetical protein
MVVRTEPTSGGSENSNSVQTCYTPSRSRSLTASSCSFSAALMVFRLRSDPVPAMCDFQALKSRAKHPQTLLAAERLALALEEFGKDSDRGHLLGPCRDVVERRVPQRGFDASRHRPSNEAFERQTEQVLEGFVAPTQ